MLWRCPACGIEIQHSEAEPLPRSGHHYRCHVCRLELVMDDATKNLTVPAIEDDMNNRPTASWDRPTPKPRLRRR
jgi:hypothetical protein